MQLAQVLVGLLALFGHFALWIAVFNRVHAIGWPRWVVVLLEKVSLAFLLGVLALLVGWMAYTGESFGDPLAQLGQNTVLLVYFWICFGTSVPVIAAWLCRVWRGDMAHVVGFEREVMRVDRLLGHLPSDDAGIRMLLRLPFNQVLRVEVNEKVLAVPRLPHELDGLTIVHLSDLHFTGKLSKEFFDVIVRRTNELEADLVAITGDILDEGKCLPWIGDVLGRLRGKSGTFCILGNHDLRLRDTPKVVREIENAGLTYLGGRWTELQVRGQSVILAGNELPWIRPAADMTACPAGQNQQRSLRVLLSHSPDQIGWARAFDFDLMLTGHMHGGQIRLPVVGPIIGPSHFGVKYSGGAYYAKPTLLHVSRGVSADQTLRINCRPEMTKLVLRPSRLKTQAEEVRTGGTVETEAVALPAPARLCPADEQTS